MRARAGILLLTVAIATAASGAGGASACGCGKFKGFVVASGESLYGVPWQIEASHPRTDTFGRRGVEFRFDMQPPAASGSGYFKGMGLPIPKRFIFSAISGSEFDPYPEADVSGVTGGRVATLRMAMSSGEELLVEPQRPSPRLRARFPWLRGLRFFDQFFAAGPRPLKMTALDGEGNVLAVSESRHGSFFAFDVGAQPVGGKDR